MSNIIPETNFRTQVAGRSRLLDTSGTSQKNLELKKSRLSLKGEIDTMRKARTAEKCINDAPLIVVPPDGATPGRVFQGCCNSWLCPRCGLMRANEEYARIVEGCKQLSDEHDMYLMTITVPGTVTTKEAEQAYLESTNRFLTTCRAHAKKHNRAWHYVQVTERQTRGHPHSHFITTFLPADAFNVYENYSRYVDEVAKLNSKIPAEMRFSPKARSKVSKREFFSRWLCLTAVRAGLGVQCNISEIENIKSVTLYIAKYLFKAAQDTAWPKGWKRVRYSHGWPKRDTVADSGAFVLLRPQDWERLARIQGEVIATDADIYMACVIHGAYNVRGVFEEQVSMEALYDRRKERGRVEYGWK